MTEKTFGESIRETREKIISVLNSSGLPIDAMDMLLGEMRTGIHAQAENEYLQTQLAKQKAEQTEQATE